MIRTLARGVSSHLAIVPTIGVNGNDATQRRTTRCVNAVGQTGSHPATNNRNSVGNNTETIQ